MCVATNIVAKDIFAKTESGARVAVMCNSTAVRVCIQVGFQIESCANHSHVGFQRCGLCMPGWTVCSYPRRVLKSALGSICAVVVLLPPANYTYVAPPQRLPNLYMTFAGSGKNRVNYGNILD